MKDPALEAFVVALERHWTERRGAPHTLSPRDFALARSWFEAGVPVGAVIEGIGRALEKDPASSSLAFCRPFVESSAARVRTTGAASPVSPVSSDAQGAALGESLSALVAALGRLGPPAPFERAWRTLREIEDLLGVAPKPNWVYLREKLGEADALVSRAALEALSDADRHALDAEADAAARRQRGRVDGAALALSVRRYLLRRARERLGLPPPLDVD
jgi:hypothetical protein